MKPDNNRARSIIVIGGGIGGLSAALAFAQSGALVTLLEQAAAFEAVGAGIQVTPNGGAVLAALGLADDADRMSLQAEAVVPLDALTGRRLARFDLTTRKAPPYRFFHRADLVTLLTDACHDAGVDLRLGTKVNAVGQDGSVTLNTGETLRESLTIGADGLHSLLRPVLNGDARPFFTGQVAWRSIIASSTTAPDARIWMAPGAHVVTYPLGGGRLNVVAVQERDAWAPEGWAHADDPTNLRAAFKGLCPELTSILEKVEETRLWGLFRHEIAGRWHGPATALLGDAAHPTLPFLAQGANLALEDAYMLAAACNANPSLARALTLYETRRKPRVARAIAAANANAVNYHLHGPKRLIAQTGLRLIGRVAPDLFLKRMDWLYDHDVTATG